MGMRGKMTDHPSPFSAEIKNMCSNISDLSQYLHDAQHLKSCGFKANCRRCEV
jgi:hypothetical protein